MGGGQEEDSLKRCHGNGLEEEEEEGEAGEKSVFRKGKSHFRPYLLRTSTTTIFSPIFYGKSKRSWLQKED